MKLDPEEQIIAAALDQAELDDASECTAAAWRAAVAWGASALRANRLQILSGRRRHQTRRWSCAR
ncbi:MAG: hypothetical protein JOY55_00610 [Mycobacterium sp.]|nr:hypothetical protein [Mycobacterium sp.]